MKRALVIVLDSVGCGHAPDADQYGDQGANTLGHLYECIPGFKLPNLESLGLCTLLDLPHQVEQRAGYAATRLTSHAAGKDTTSGHWELMGHVIKTPFATYRTFPQDLIDGLSRATHTGFIGNYAASGTEIIATLGPEHLATGHPILYTSADSVMQIAAHEESFGLERLLDICRTAREFLDSRGIRIGRVIARPFLGDSSHGFYRTSNRHDFSMTPGQTALDRLQTAGIATVGIGKISDIFAGAGIDVSFPTHSNADGMALISKLWNESHPSARLLFANLVDFDALYGHRRDPHGYANCLREFDGWLGSFLANINEGDLLMITADHGNDPYHPGTDHTREQVPLLAYGTGNIARCSAFQDVAGILETFFQSN